MAAAVGDADHRKTVRPRATTLLPKLGNAEKYSRRLEGSDLKPLQGSAHNTDLSVSDRLGVRRREERKLVQRVTDRFF
jgi:hypothetical protein